MLRLLPHCSIHSSNLPLHLHSVRNGRQCSSPTSAKKSNARESSRQTKESTLGVSRALVAKSAVVVFGLGFLDAGYSGDWSRIGAISKETEEVLKLAAYLVVPLCLLLAVYISDDEKTV